LSSDHIDKLKNKIWINNGENLKFINRFELESFLSIGWKLGRKLNKKTL